MTEIKEKLMTGLEFVKKHKVPVLIVGSIFWLLFIDEYSVVFRQIPLILTSHKLERQKQYYNNKIQQDSIMLYELQTNDENLKRFAREQYFMKADNEDVFIVEEKE